MSYYPQSIPADTSETCRGCGKRKKISAKLCRRCNPIFLSYTRAITWASLNASGPCVLAYQDYCHDRCGYIAWPGVETKEVVA
jgi:hypothetical protein